MERIAPATAVPVRPPSRRVPAAGSSTPSGPADSVSLSGAATRALSDPSLGLCAAAAPLGPIATAVVVGAGPAGLATAIKLAEAGVQVRVLEARGLDYSRRVHLNLREAALHGLQDLQVLDRVMQDAGWIAREEDLHRGVVSRPSPIQPQADRVPRNGASVMGSEPVVQVETCDLERALLDRALDLGVQVQDHTRAELHRVGRSFAVTTLADDGARQDLGTPGLVVVADGANSKTRDQLGIPFEASSDPAWFIGGHVQVPLGPVVRKMVMPGEDGFQQHLMATGHALHPDAWVLAEVEPRYRDLPPDQRLDYFCRQASEVLFRKVRPEDVDWGGTHLAMVQNRAAATSVAGDNLVLVGDASRTGYAWCSGGANLAITADPQNVLNLVEHVNLDGWTREKALHYFDLKARIIGDAWLAEGAGEFGGARTVS